MKTQYKYLVLVLAVLLSGTIRAQQLPLFSQYLFNGFLINPAYTGLDGYSAVNIASREQWLGIPNSPTTNLISYQTRLLRNSFVKKSASARRKMMSRYTSGRVGIGGYVFNDQNGLIRRTGALGTYAYHIKMGSNVISYALSVSICQFSIDRSKIQTDYTRDQLLDNTALSMIIPDCGVGVVYSSKTYYAGLSADQLLQAYLKFGKAIDQDLRIYRTYYLTGGYRYEIDKLTAIEPSVLVKMTQTAAAQADITCRYYFMRNYWAGASFRTGSAIIIMGGLSVDRYHFGYSFDYNLNGVAQRFGTHEIMAAYKFGDNASRLRWLNR